MQTTAMLSPNGQQDTEGDGPATQMFVATLKGVVTLERPAPGAPWARTATTLEDRHVGALLMEPGSGKLFAGAHGGGGVWVSDDGTARSWRPVVNGLDRQNVYSLALRRRGGRTTLFVGVEPAAIYRSDDLGETWRELPALRHVPGTEKWSFPAPPHIAHVKCMTVHPSAPATLFACVEQGALLRSDDDGETWTEFDGYVWPDDATYHDVHRLTIDPRNHDVCYLATGVGLNRSDDGGVTWRALTSRRDRLGYPDFFSIDPRDPDVLYMAGARTTPSQWRTDHFADAAVLKSTDAGRTWRELHGGLPSPIVGSIEAMAIHAWPGGATLSLATATGEVYASDDGGESWACIADGLAPVSKAGHYRSFTVPPAHPIPGAPAHA
ncbi:MAG: WD40/YVTN/BNR-like repeat-containing protein [Rhodospirillaceae bacterium]